MENSNTTLKVEEEKTIESSPTSQNLSINLPAVEEMLKSGLHFGHSRTKSNPKMKDYILGYQQGISILDLAKTRNCLEKALLEIEKIAKEGKKIIFVGTRPVVKDLVKEVAEKTGMFYVNERWIGGTLTNFKVISKRIQDLLDLEEEKRVGDLKKYTKKERVVLNKKMEKMEQKFGGIKQIKEIPGLIIVADPKENLIALQEARKSNIPTVAICDTDANPEMIDFPIPANDEAISSVEMILNLIEEVISKNIA